MSEEIAQAAGDLAYWRQRAEACAGRAHGLANEVMQERAKRMQAEADTTWWHATVANYVTSATVADREILRDTMAEALIGLHPGTTLLAVAQAAAAFVEAGEYDDLASLLVALKEAVKEWKR